MIVFAEHHNQYLVELLQQRNYKDIVQAARELELPLAMLFSLLFSPILSIGDRDLQFVADRFGQNFADFKDSWLQSNSHNLSVGAALAETGPYIMIDTSGMQR